MNTNLKGAIDNLETKIKEYRYDCGKLNQAQLQVQKITDELENIEHSNWIDTDDVPFLVDLKRVAVADTKWYKESAELKLYALKFAAYKVGRFRSTQRAEP